jgi:hypothetical protein
MQKNFRENACEGEGAEEGGNATPPQGLMLVQESGVKAGEAGDREGRDRRISDYRRSLKTFGRIPVTY